MPRAIIWTQQRDQKIRDMRAAGASWDEVATELDLSRDAVLRRGAALGISTRQKTPLKPDTRGLRQRQPLRANDPLAKQILDEAPPLNLDE